MTNKELLIKLITDSICKPYGRTLDYTNESKLAKAISIINSITDSKTLSKAATVEEEVNELEQIQRSHADSLVVPTITSGDL